MLAASDRYQPSEADLRRLKAPKVRRWRRARRKRCRHDDICVTDVVTDLIEILGSDPNAEVRHKTVAALARFIGRDGRARDAMTGPPITIRTLQFVMSREPLRLAVTLTFAAARLPCVTCGGESGNLRRSYGFPRGNFGANVSTSSLSPTADSRASCDGRPGPRCVLAAAA
jgi:hypothetical protein